MNKKFSRRIEPPPTIKRLKNLCFRAILVSRFNNTCVWNKKVRSDIIFDSELPLKDGELIETRVRMYSIATGGVIEEEGVKYYEVYPELYDYSQACVINTALRMMAACNGETKLNYAS